eukprot:CAMPEP_0195524048 /NCGR_PEP_ID=MMETSP0794_2-20130614/23674_1 /TAXON_ID=515487 /ORGANISM="Stephanopyxis turris, Strain CCMP 815" /LENGTH=379 /DNA_ID=CAMNT_0040654191 /DNA_START=206 /DNA_END=1346 /DNA_ORIENTATION=-
MMNIEPVDDSEKRRKRKRDRIVLDVGGATFTTAISTLVSNSIYFNSLFSELWSHEEIDHDEPIFIDQDPEPFAILLSFMELDMLRAKKLTRDVLFQAEFLGMERLINAIKCTAHLNMNPTFSESDEEAISAFDAKHNGIVGAISSGILPAYITKYVQSKEFAIIMVFDPGECHFEIFDDLVIELTAPLHAIDPSHQQNSTAMGKVPNCCTFLDALNWLHRRGFTTREQDFEEANVQGSNVLETILNLSFSRITNQRGLTESLSQIIINETHEVVEDRKEFACILIPTDERVSVEADIGDSHEFNITRPDETTASIINISEVGYTSLSEAMNWLQENSYHKRETDLEVIYNKVIERRVNYYEDSRSISTGRLWSRKLPPL